MGWTRRTVVLGGAAGLAAAALGAAPERRYAALSLVGQELTVVSFRAGTGSHLDTSERERVLLPDARLDEVVVKAIEAALVQQGSAPPALLLPSAPAHYAGQAEMVNDERFQANAALQPALAALQAQASHLVLATRQRTPGGLKGVRLPSGARSAEGLGFYMDPQWREQQGNTQVDSSGLLAAFAHLRISLVDLASGRVLARQVLAASQLLPTPPGQRDPWQSLSLERKLEALGALLRSEVERTTALLLAGA